MPTIQDEKYLQIIKDAIQVCKSYKPKFGHGKGLTLTEFQILYQSDPFYAWFGLDSPSMYAAHKAAGGMTSVYRQIGIGCQRLFVQLLIDNLGLTTQEATWFYEVEKIAGKKQNLYLDARIPIANINASRKLAVTNWLQTACQEIGVAPEISQVMKGAVFEVRQGYKSKDSKRQTADIANAAAAYRQGYLPVILLFSTQIDDDVAYRYKKARWLILNGTLTGLSTNSAYVFCNEVLGYDLANFFHQYSSEIKQELGSVLETLLG